MKCKVKATIEIEVDEGDLRDMGEDIDVVAALTETRMREGKGKVINVTDWFWKEGGRNR